MTVIAGYVDRKARRVHLAADSASVAGDGIVIPKLKLHRLRVGLADSAIFGAAGFAALGAVVTSHLNLEAAPDTDEDADRWAQATAEAITELAIEHLLVDTQEDDGRADMALLFAWRHRLWAMSHDIAVPVDRYCAVGSGSAVAMGAMWALARAGVAPRKIPRRAVSASIEHMDGIQGPVRADATEAG